MLHCFRCSMPRSEWPSRASSCSSQPRTSSTQPGRAHGTRSSGTSFRSRASRYAASSSRWPSSRSRSPSRSVAADPTPVRRRPPGGVPELQLEHGLDPLRVVVLVEAELAQQPRRRAESPLEQRHDPLGVRDPELAADDARQAPVPVAAKKEQAELLGMPERPERLRAPAHALGWMRPRTSPSGSPRSTTSSPSSRNVRSLPSPSRSGSVPFQVSSMRLPSLPRSAPEIVPDAIRSPVRTLAPFEVACASCCGIVQ